MGKNTFFVLIILSMGMSLCGCQSDYQNMKNGLAKEYQDRYNSCSVSADFFRQYAGFGFIEKNGICQCNGRKCEGNQICSLFGDCITPLECNNCAECQTDEEKCVDNNTFQKCENGKLNEISCSSCNLDENICYMHRCVTNLEGETLLITISSKGEKEENKPCPDGCNETLTDCKNSQQPSVECTADSQCRAPKSACDNGKCVECKKDDTKCDNEGEWNCENGSWAGPVSCNDYGCKDNKKCNTAPSPECADDSDCSDPIKSICDNGQCVECKKDDTKCEDEEEWHCENGSWAGPVSCNDLGCKDDKQCNTEPPDPHSECAKDSDCTEGDKSICDNGKCVECKTDGTKCDEKGEWQCNNGMWNGPTPCKLGCKKDKTVCADTCLKDVYKCDNYVLKCKTEKDGDYYEVGKEALPYDIEAMANSYCNKQYQNDNYICPTPTNAPGTLNDACNCYEGDYYCLDETWYNCAKSNMVDDKKCKKACSPEGEIIYREDVDQMCTCADTGTCNNNGTYQCAGSGAGHAQVCKKPCWTSAETNTRVIGFKESGGVFVFSTECWSGSGTLDYPLQGCEFTQDATTKFQTFLTSPKGTEFEDIEINCPSQILNFVKDSLIHFDAIYNESTMDQKAAEVVCTGKNTDDKHNSYLYTLTFTSL